MEEKDTNVLVEETQNEEVVAAPQKKVEFMELMKKYLIIGLSALCAIFAILGKILLVSYATGAAYSVYIASIWMDFIGFGFAVAGLVILCYNFVKNHKFEFSKEVFINLMAFLVLLIRFI